VFDCTAGVNGGFDTVDPKGYIDVKNLTFAGMSATKSDCPSGYNANCTIYKLTTTSADGSLTFTMRLASEPVLINNIRVEPNYAKIDVSINYPWASASGLWNQSIARVGLVAYTAGRSGTASATYSRVNNNDAVVFSVGDKSAYFSWDGTSTLSGTSATVYLDSISGATLAALDCSSFKCGIITSIYVGELQFRQLYMNGLGWKTEMLLFSWDAVQPANVFWDPAIGLMDPPTQNDSSAAALIPSLAIAFAAALYNNLF